MTDLQKDILNNIEQSAFNGQLSDTFWVELFKLTEAYSGIKSVKRYATNNKITPQAVYKYRNIFQCFDCKFVIDKD